MKVFINLRKNTPDHNDSLELLALKELKLLIHNLPDSIKHTEFIYFKLLVRSSNVLQRENICIPMDLYNSSNNDILNWSGLGLKTINDISFNLSVGLDANFVLKASFFNKKKLLESTYKLNILAIKLLPHIQEQFIWIDSYLEYDLESKNIFSELNIADDLDYIFLRDNLAMKMKEKADNFRFKALLDIVDHGNPLAVLAISPEWLLNMDVYYFGCNTRNKNLIKEQNIVILADFLQFKISRIRLLKNTGIKSLKGLSASIIAAYKKGPPPIQSQTGTTQSTLHDCFLHSISKITNEKHVMIIERRLGVNGEVETLEAIAEVLNITRERVRQIQKKIILQIIDNEFWDDVLKLKLDKIINDASMPVYLDKIASIDPWFAGFEENPILLMQVLANFSHLKVYSLNIENKIILSPIMQNSWDALKEDILDTIEKNLSIKYTIDDIEMLIEYELQQVSIPYLYKIMYDEIESHFNFSLIDGELILTSLGNTIGSYLRSLLEEIDTPLHYKEIMHLYERKYGIKISSRNIHARLSYGDFLLFNRGTYGTQKHLLVSNEQQKDILEQAEILLDSNHSKQWHVDDILSCLEGYCFSKYVLNIILNTSNKLFYLGQMVWGFKDLDIAANDRLQVKKVVADVLRNNRKPMSIENINNEVRKVRSLGSYFYTSLKPNELYSRLNPGTWGLLDRDFILPLKEWREIKDSFYSHLQELKKSLHTSELLKAVLEKYPILYQVSASHIMGVLSADERFKVWRGSFLGLEEWDTSRRMTINEGIKSLIDSGEIENSTSYIEERLKTLLAYNFQKSRISLELNKHNYYFDKIFQVWKKNT